MRIGFFGGSFDPPHLGHLSIARAATSAFALDQVLFAPTGRQPLKPTGPSASFGDRIAMVKLLCEGHPAFLASTLDAPLSNTPNYTVDTLRRLRSTITPDDSISVIVGLDAFLDIRRWRTPDTLFTLADWIVVTRPGLSLTQLDKLALTPDQFQRVHTLDGIAHPASATEIRALLHSGSACKNFLPPAILRYIRANHLYGT
jgi:nicotinate-nucleotide adenylyltransferase